MSFFVGSGAARADEDVALKPEQVLATMKKVVAWQTTHADDYWSKGWERATYDAGVMALYDVSREKTYLDAMLAMGRDNQWQLGKRIYHADYHTISQTYLELYLIEKDPQMIAPTRERFDFILQHPRNESLEANPQQPLEWSWSDALFMAPPAWARLYAATGDRRYLDFMDKEWWATTEALYDPTDKLFYRDSRFIGRKSRNGKKIFWSRGNGWVYAGLARVLDYLPPEHPSRPRYIKLFREMTEAIVRSQQSNGLWRPSLLDPDAVPKGETSGSALFVYGLAWGINHDILDAAKYWPVASRGWTALVGKVNPDGKLGAVQPFGDRPVPFEDDSTNIYGTGAFLLAGSEVYRYLTQAQVGKNKTVVLDDFFNHETKKDANGKPIAWHYKWDDAGNGGFSLFGQVFQSYGAKTETLSDPPTAANLKNADVYIIVDPDDKKESEQPNFIEPQHIAAIKDWVKAGGALVLMGNDFGNCEFEHFNKLAREFGIEFNKDSVNRGAGNRFEGGKIIIDAGSPIFKTARKVYLKEISTLRLSGAAKSIQDWNGDTVMAVAKYGEGTVFAVGDPWLYNEYTDGRKLPADFELQSRS